MATISNIAFYEKMKVLNLHEYENANTPEDKAYFKMMADCWARKIEMVTPKKKKAVNMSSITVLWR